MFEKDSHRLCHHSVAHNELDLPITLQSTADGLFCHDTKLRSLLSALPFTQMKQKSLKAYVRHDGRRRHVGRLLGRLRS